MNKLPHMTRKYLNLVASRPILKKCSSIHNVTTFAVILECLVEIVDVFGKLISKNLVHLCFSYKLVVPLNPSRNRITAPHLRNKR